MPAPVPCPCGASASLRGCRACLRKYRTSWMRKSRTRPKVDVAALRAIALQKAIDAIRR